MPPLPLLLALGASTALAAPVPDGATAFGPDGYAIVVGSRRPGAGQQPLRWAAADAARVAHVLTELGGLPSDHIDTLTDPTRAELDAAFTRARARIAADRAAGRASSLVFYYSGHARAEALDLGTEPLPLSDLREALTGSGARIHLVVLDACQSGAATGVKGVAPAAGFSIASVDGLQSEGGAVLASSTASELSQESDALQGSYFTHHLVSGLRGAADDNADGTVSLQEAYRYAYDRTVVSTSETAVGRQHPTLKTDLRGRGEVAWTRPGGARAGLTLGPADTGEILLAREDTGTVSAEVSKAPGDTLRLALPAGDYAVWWTRGHDRQRCALTLTDGEDTPFAPRRCRAVALETVATKGAPSASPAESWGVEGGLGGLRVGTSSYTDRLQDFSFTEQERLFGLPTAHLAVAWSPLRHLAMVGTLGTLDGANWRREDVGYGTDDESNTDFSWFTRRASVSARGQLPLLRDWLVPYAQAGGGVAWAGTRFEDPARDVLEDERFVGWHLAGAVGLQLMPSGKGGWRHLGVFGQVEASTAPVIDNLLDDRHDSGGVATTFGLRAAF